MNSNKTVDGSLVQDNTASKPIKTGDSGRPHAHEDNSAPQQSAVEIPDRSKLREHVPTDFSTFHVCASNRTAARAAQDLASERANVVFIAGVSGVGKTHLLNAIQGACEEKGQNVVLETMGDFARQFHDAAKLNSHTVWEAWNNRYQGFDVVLFDNLHWLKGKDGASKAFTQHLFQLIDLGVKLAFTSLEPIDHFKLKREARARLMSGTIAHIREPSPSECREQIAFRAEQMGMQLSAEAVDALYAAGTKAAPQIGAALRAMASELLASPQAQPHEALLAACSIFRSSQRRTQTVREVIEKTSAYYEMTPRQLCGKGRTRKVSTARHVAMYLARQHSPQSLTDLAASFQRKSHSTIDHACGKIENALNQDDEINQAVRDIRASLGID